MTVGLLWFRQDLRTMDNPAFAKACNEQEILMPLYILDQDAFHIGSAQKWWLHHSLQSLASSLTKMGLNLILRKGNAFEIITQLSKELPINTVYWNHAYEPLIIHQDKSIQSRLEKTGIKVITTNGTLLRDPQNLKTKKGTYFKKFTPFWQCCLKSLVPAKLVTITKHPKPLAIASDKLNDWHLLPRKPNWAKAFSHYWQPGEIGAKRQLTKFIKQHLCNYHRLRDYPAANATSRLSPHLHFGELSPWQIWRALEEVKWDPSYNSNAHNRFLTELGWREFSYYLLFHVPDLPLTNFNTTFNKFSWVVNEPSLECWRHGQTGFPIIDAGMRELWKTGYMHNRVRMLVASFLTKDLLIDWREGAAWFLDTLVDADLANNSASWQWVAGSGVDAAPYFRIFNPVLQSEKFDPEGTYIRQWVPELASVEKPWIHAPWTAPQIKLGLKLGKEYPKPIINHKTAYEYAIQAYKRIKNNSIT